MNEIPYSRISGIGETWCYNCKEHTFVCPECGSDLCVFCMDWCDGCNGMVRWDL